MKKRIGTIYGTPIVEGDKNLKTTNEVHISELGGGNTENSTGVEYEYFILDNPNNDDGVSAQFKEMLGSTVIVETICEIGGDINIFPAVTGAQFDYHIAVKTAVLPTTMHSMGMTLTFPGKVIDNIKLLESAIGTDLSSVINLIERSRVTEAAYEDLKNKIITGQL